MRKTKLLFGILFIGALFFWKDDVVKTWLESGPFADSGTPVFGTASPEDEPVEAGVGRYFANLWSHRIVSDNDDGGTPSARDGAKADRLRVSHAVQKSCRHALKLREDFLRAVEKGDVEQCRELEEQMQQALVACDRDLGDSTLRFR